MEDYKYYCGYVINNDKSVMLHVRKASSNIIDYYSKVEIPEDLDSKDLIKFVLTELLSIMAMDFSSKLLITEEPLTDAGSNKIIPIVISYIDEFGNAIVDMSLQENYEANIKEIRKVHNPIHISAISLGSCYGLKEADTKMIDSAIFSNKPKVNNMIVKTIDDYYILNESIICTLKNQND